MEKKIVYPDMDIRVIKGRIDIVECRTNVYRKFKGIGYLVPVYKEYQLYKWVENEQEAIVYFITECEKIRSLYKHHPAFQIEVAPDWMQKYSEKKWYKRCYRDMVV